MGGQATPIRQRWVVLGVILLAFLLRVWALGQGELWFDETLSAVIAAKGWVGIVRYTLTTPFEHPPFYYLFLHAWLRGAGNSEFALRFFSVFWGILLIPLTYRFMASVGGHSFGLLAALVTALSAVQIDHSQNARMYSLLPVLAILLWLCFFRALHTGRLRWWGAFLIVATLGLATHYYFSLLLLAPLFFLFMGGPRYRRLAIYLSLGLVGYALLLVGWFGLSSGFREAVQQTVVGAGGGASSLSQRIEHTVGGLLSEPPVAGHIALAVLAVLGAIFWPLPKPPRDHPVRLIGSRRFLLVWLLVPWLVALAIPYWLQDRHLAYLLPALAALVACGLLVLRARSSLLFLAGLLLVAATAGYWLVRQDVEPEFEFGRIMAYIEDRALPDDLVVMNQPAFWPLTGYYAHRDLETVYVTGESEEAVDRQMRDLVGQAARIWLGPVGAWTEDPEARVEQWLATRAYPWQKEWFPGGGSAGLYFTTDSLEPLPVHPALRWDDGIRLLAVHSSSRIVGPSDAVRLAFTWHAENPVDSPRLVSLYLTDQAGRVWAKRQSEPCGGWCPAEGWETASPVRDQHALMIPPGTPPGTYQMQVALYSPQAGRELEAMGSGPRVDLGSVEVVQPEQAETVLAPELMVQHRLRAHFNDEITLLGFDLDPVDVPAGGTLSLDLHWLVSNPPADNYTLLLELLAPDGALAAHWQRSPVNDSLPTKDWQPGQYLRGLQQLGLPPQIEPGNYELQVKLLDAAGQPIPFNPAPTGSGLRRLLAWAASTVNEGLVLARLQIAEPPERPHSFDLPGMAFPVNYQLGQQVELLGYDLDLASAEPGGEIALTLYWQARGATGRPYKVFTHLGRDGLAPLAQHDGVPGEGCCPPDTWVEGEVIVDRHLIPLAADLIPGTYHLTAGMYHEASGERLPVSTAQAGEVLGDQIPLTEIDILPRRTPMPVPVLPEMTHRIYLPLVESNQ